MNTVKVDKKNQIPASSFAIGGNYDERLSIAKSALEKSLKPRAGVTVNHAVWNIEGIRVHYLENGFHLKHCIIPFEKLKEHVLAFYSSKESSDVTIFYYIEDNLSKVCLSYLESGKEVEAL